MSRIKFYASRHFPWKENNEDNEAISKLDFFNSKIYINAKKVYVEGRPYCPVQNNWNGILTLTLTFYKERNKTTLKKIQNAVLKDNLLQWIHNNEILTLTSGFDGGCGYSLHIMNLPTIANQNKMKCYFNLWRRQNLSLL